MNDRSAIEIELARHVVADPINTASSSDGAFPTVTRTRFADQAYTHLFHRIITGEFKEGDMLPSENDLCGLFGVSRPVVREALQRLRADGLIDSRRGSGSFVQQRPPMDMSSADMAEKLRGLLENLEFRSVIEPQAAFLAAERRTAADLAAIRTAVEQLEQVAVINGGIGHHLDFAFHVAVAAAAGNRRFVDAIRMVEYDIDHGVNLVRYLVRFDHLERSRSVLADHTRILNAIERRNAKAARSAMQDHLEQARIRMQEGRPVAARGASRPLRDKAVRASSKG
jgi:GntR family transcriptional regulator, transcriptional repressor for pyruvate dehydrogenase complex